MDLGPIGVRCEESREIVSAYVYAAKVIFLSTTISRPLFLTLYLVSHSGCGMIRVFRLFAAYFMLFLLLSVYVVGCATSIYGFCLVSISYTIPRAKKRVNTIVDVHSVRELPAKPSGDL